MLLWAQGSGESFLKLLPGIHTVSTPPLNCEISWCSGSSIWTGTTDPQELAQHRETETPNHHVCSDTWLTIRPIGSENHVLSPGDHLEHHSNDLPLPWSLGPSTETRNCKEYLRTLLWLVQINHLKSYISDLSETNRFYSPNPTPSPLCTNILNQTFKPLKLWTRVSTLHKHCIHGIVPKSSRCPINIYWRDRRKEEGKEEKTLTHAPELPQIQG